MADCSKIPTLELVEDSKKGMNDIVSFANSSYNTYQSEFDNSTRTTIKGVLNKLGGNNKGNYLDDPLLQDDVDYAYFSATQTKYKIAAGVLAPYQVDSTTYPDPETDPSLTVFDYATNSKLDSEITTAQSDIVGGSIFKGSNGEYVQNGDTVPVGTTHLRVLVGGKPTIVAMYPVASGVVSNLTDNLCTIGTTGVDFVSSAKEFNDISAWMDNESNIDVTDKLKSFFIAMNEKGLEAYGSGFVKVTSQVNTFGVPYDFSGLTVTLPVTVDATITGTNGSPFVCTDPDTQVIGSFDLGVFTEGQGKTSSLDGFGNVSVLIESTEPAYTRDDGGTISTVNKTDILYCTKGFHRATPAIYEITTPVTITVRPIRNLITIKPATFVIEGKPAANQIQALVRIERNNVKVTGGYVNSRDISISEGEQVLRSVYYPYGVVNVTYEDVTTTTSNLSFCYQVVGYGTYGMRLKNCQDISGWALQDGNFIRDTVVEDCTGTRIGSHAMAYNFTSENFTSTLKGIDVMGKGKLRITGTKHLFSDTVSDSPIRTREDYGQCWDGDIEIDGTEIIVSPDSTQSSISLLKLSFSKFTAEDLTQDVIAGRTISITNTTVTSYKSTQVSFVPIEFSTDHNQSSVLPKEINITHIDLDGDIRPTYSGIPAYLDTNIQQVTTTFNLKGLRNSTGLNSLFQQISDIDKPNVRNKVIRNYFEHKDFRATVSLPDGWEINIKESDVIYLDAGIGGFTEQGKYRITRSVVSGDTCRASAGGLMYLFDNEFLETTTLTLGPGVVWCNGNVIQPGVTLDGGGPTTSSEMWERRVGFEP